MNISKIFFFLSILILFGSMCKSQTIDPFYEVGTWPGFRSGAVSFTFDDNCPNQLTKVLPMFDEYGFKMTFFTVINWGPNWTALKAAASNGHEIASHTLSHPHLGTLTDAQQTAELKDSRDDINNQISGQKCLTIAYPYCEPGSVDLDKKYYIAGRGCSGVVESKTPADFMNISSIICGNLGAVKTAQDFINKFNSAANSKGWVVFLIHGIDADADGYSPTNSTELKGALEYLNTSKDKLWESTFLNVFLYIRERNNVSVKEISVEDSIFTVNVTDTLNNSIYNYPVTIRRSLPSGWASATVSQNGKRLNSEIVYADSLKYVMFDVVPDSGEIHIKKISAVLPVELDSFSALTLSNAIQLNWETATELHNNGFTVERSLDKNNWKQIAFIKGKGTTTEPSSYSYKDIPGTIGRIYYRLKQIDYNGTCTYSKIVEAAIAEPESFNLKQNYPNPFNPVTIINYEIPEDSFITLNVYDILGQKVATLVNKQEPSGEHSVKFDGSNLSGGLYFYTLKTGNYRSTKKLILLK